MRPHLVLLSTHSSGGAPLFRLLSPVKIVAVAVMLMLLGSNRTLFNSLYREIAKVLKYPSVPYGVHGCRTARYVGRTFSSPRCTFARWDFSPALPFLASPSTTVSSFPS